MMSVVFLHVTSTAWFYVEQQTKEWYIYNALRCTTKWGVTVFVMISGMLFLNPQKQIRMKKLYFIYIKRLVIILIVWSFAYASEPVFKAIITKDILNIDSFSVAESFVLGHQHLWFLYMIIGLYMMLPFIKAISLDIERMYYYICCGILFTIIFPIIYELKGFWSFKLMGDFIKKFSVEMVVGYSLYFILGYFWSITDINRLKRIAMYITAIIALIFSVLLTARSGGRHYLVDGTMSIGNFIITNAIFVFGKYEFANILDKKEKLKKMIGYLATLSLGIYLIHMFFVKKITKYSINNFDNPIIISFLTFTIVIFLSGIIVAVMKKIPFLRKIV